MRCLRDVQKFVAVRGQQPDVADRQKNGVVGLEVGAMQK